MKLYLKLFLAMAIPYTLVMMLFTLNPGLALVSGILYGGAMSLLFGTIQHLSFRGKKADAEHSVRQSRTLEIDHNIDDTFNLCLEAYTVLKRAVIKKVDRQAATIEVRTGANLRTYGELITIKIAPLDAHTSTVTISSRPRVKSTMIDYGRNLRNVNLLALYLREQIASDHLSYHAIQQLAQEQSSQSVEQSVLNASHQR